MNEKNARIRALEAELAACKKNWVHNPIDTIENLEKERNAIKARMAELEEYIRRVSAGLTTGIIIGTREKDERDALKARVAEFEGVAADKCICHGLPHLLFVKCREKEGGLND